ncbi:MAG TPA: LLM class flavin-dependent oxidoreductase [Acidimicrobiales bacterium]|jgi:alkanesulfonate monooxygenase SsuD/methylene tetrahydromethanopterin reductase-like flavin-dependent oxidoreductase (luciferase family)|nr:LLM class flavin-dependent oxidoreductase [Acidimicrobiales bacterium]
MAFFGLRFDFRNPSFAGTTMGERYRAALAMAEWADHLGAVALILSEHHGSDDGYLPSPLPLAAAMAARTSNVRINLAALVASFHDPLRLAEDIAVVDLISEGRLDLIITNGYVGDEFAMFGQPIGRRAQRTTELVSVLRQAWTGEPFEYRGRTVTVTPRPHQDGGPKISLGGSTEPAARRAARIGDGFMPSTPAVWEFYRDEVIALGRPDPGPHPGGSTEFVHLALDPEEGWERIAPHAMHEVNAYGAWMAAAGLGDSGGYVPVGDADTLRATGQYRVLTPDQMVAELSEQGPFAFVAFHPLMGGIPPELAWDSLHLFEHEVLPRL